TRAVEDEMAVTGLRAKRKKAQADLGEALEHAGMLEAALKNKMGLAVSELSELQRDLLQEFYERKEQTRTEDETAMLELGGALALKLLKSRVMAESHGRSIQRFADSLGAAGNPTVVVEELLRK